jgi:hypothetical protein
MVLAIPDTNLPLSLLEVLDIFYRTWICFVFVFGKSKTKLKKSVVVGFILKKLFKKKHTHRCKINEKHEQVNIKMLEKNTINTKMLDRMLLHNQLVCENMNERDVNILVPFEVVNCAFSI